VPGDDIDDTLLASDTDQVDLADTADAMRAATNAPSMRREDTGDEWRAGDRLGRYTLVDRLGEGGMGVVWQAEDRELERRVAIKRLHPDRAETGSSATDGAARLLREAQAMARLSHPNVLPVFDFGESRGDVYLAMELVEGTTLKKWLKTRRPWRHVVRMFTGAGRGLAAAHAAGVVHRDFKPANVLVGNDERPRVVDFGLARSAGSALESQGAVGAFDSPLTQHGDVMGTPLYMAPEQLRGDAVDERSDQYGFCASLWEGLYGAPPTRADDFDQLRQRVEAGDIDAPDRSDVPARIERILRRGLAPKSVDRYSSMSSLLAELDHDPAVLRWKIAVGAVIALLVAAAVYGFVLRKSAATAVCTPDEDRFAGVWDSDTETRVRNAVGQAGGETVASRAVEQLDGLRDRWLSAQQDACEDTRVHQTHTERQLEARTSCLDRRFGALRAALGALDRVTDARGAARFVTQIAAIDVADCDSASPDDDPLAGADPETRGALTAVLDDIDRASSLRTAKQFDEARPIIDNAIARARVLGNDAVLAQALTAKAAIHQFTDEFDDGLVTVDEAIALATKTGGSLLGFAQLRKMDILSKARRHDESLALRASTQAAFDNATPSDGLRASVKRRIGKVLYQASHFDEARQLLDEAIEIERRLLADAGGSAQGIELALEQSLGLRASIASILGDHETAIANAAERLTIRERWMGAGHPAVLIVLRQLATFHGDAGNTDDSIEFSRRALDIATETGAAARELAMIHRGLGLTLQAANRHDEALGPMQRALDLQRAELGETSLDAADSWWMLGTVQARVGAHEDAEASLRKALGIFESQLGREHQNVAFVLVALGFAAKERGDCAPALDELDQAVGIMKRAVGTNNPLYAIVLAEAAGCRALLGKPEAAEQLRNVLAIYDAVGADAGLRGAAELDLARALVKRTPDAAVKLAKGARERIVDSPNDVELLADIDAWLAEHE
jgi:tetratricopeptide (TPR) repeat protein